MPIIQDKDAELDGVIQVAKLMCIAARTAPKARGIDNVVSCIVYGREDIERIALEMERVGKELGWNFMIRDADSIRKAHAIVLIGLRNPVPTGLNCELCGFNCEEIKKIFKERKVFKAPYCAFQLLNLGIALGSAVKIASDLNVDNRIMISIGVAAKRVGIINADIVLGVPLASLGKNPFFDRKPLEKR
ncbi:MAG: hypothetical protein B6V02_02445 [Thermoprotei archaeon ex4572_64]|nr:MAG: hypothetical protein B6V02_02445 [Thermoprotei archaeon ex4572_64]